METRRRRPPDVTARPRPLRALCALVVAALACVPAAPGAAAAQELPGGVQVGGGVYLWHFQPLGLPGVDEKSEIYAAFVNLDRSAGAWDFHVQGRWRDDKLRSFFPSTVWVEEAWVSWRGALGGSGRPDSAGQTSAPHAAAVTVRAGKMYQRLGRFWNGLFFGNLHSFDGLKLDPEVGVEAALQLPVAADAGLELYTQALIASDRINVSLPGRDVESLDGAEESGLAAGVRLELPVGRPGGVPLRGTVGLSGLVERVEVGGTGSGEESGAGPSAEADLGHVAADLELRWGDLVAYVERTRRFGGGPGAFGSVRRPSLATGVAASRATWWLAGARAEIGPVVLRYNYSAAGYDDGGFREIIHQPALTVRAAPGASVFVEYDGWRREAVRAGASDRRIDRSLNVILFLRI